MHQSILDVSHSYFSYISAASTSPPSSVKLQALQKELDEATVVRRRERQATLQKIAEGEEKNEQEYQEWVNKIKELQEEGDKERERIEKELVEVCVYTWNDGRFSNL
jgi:hypothetical protein